jgi:hypothetical protein
MDRFEPEWLNHGGAPSPLRDEVALMLRRECSASQADSIFAAALAIDMVRKWIVGQPTDQVMFVRDPEHPDRMPIAYTL